MAEQPLVIDDDDRYSRLRLIAWWDQDKLAQAHVMVVGAGALGNEVLKNLALMGIGRITVVDFDTIEDSNLSRSVLFRPSDRGRSKVAVAAEFLTRLNPDCQVIPEHANIITEIGLGRFSDVDLVIGCLDNREARLWVNRCCWKTTTPWIDGGIQEINGVVKVFVPPDSACYECAMTENDYRLINLRYSCPLLRQEDLLAGKVPTAPTISSIIGGMQVQEALKLLHGLPIKSGAACVFNGVTNQFYQTSFQRCEDCLSHETWASVVESDLTNHDRLGDLLNLGRSELSDPVQLRLERDLVVDVHCEACDERRPVMRPRYVVSVSEAACARCGQTAKPTIVHTLDQASVFLDEQLIRLGIPDRDIVQLEGPEGTVSVLLRGSSDG
ncbi:MAG TPA: ThiF family adenylyltransferase [Planctomycetes bacterium]|nr:ThiF family adenylyltransferase [Planctomycetaceae bacterium]HIM28750.1 ThiF family adenylyltransferase [Planctomycetota bacterium]